MRVAILIGSASAAIFFAASLGLTFLAQHYILHLARDFVIDRTRRYADPAVDIAELALRQPGIERVFDDEVLLIARQAITGYRENPRAYIARLVARERPATPAAGADRPAGARENVLRWEERVREYCERTLDRLLRDLRVFSGSNLAVALLAAWCARRARRGQASWLVGVAGLLLASVAYGVIMYVDGFSYFSLLFSTYLGWWYPVLLGVTFLALYLAYGRREGAPGA